MLIDVPSFMVNNKKIRYDSGDCISTFLYLLLPSDNDPSRTPKKQWVVEPHRATWLAVSFRDCEASVYSSGYGS